MQLEMNLEQLRGKKIFLATPMYGGVCHGAYTKALADLMILATKHAIDVKLYFMFNESLITRARNYLADEFLRSGYDYLLFIDSDIHFEAQDVLVLSHFAINNDNMDIICGPYPKKAISWEKIKRALLITILFCLKSLLVTLFSIPLMVLESLASKNQSK